MQTYVSVPPQLQKGHGHFHQLDSAYNGQLLHQTGPNGTCPAPGMSWGDRKDDKCDFNQTYAIADMI